MFCYLIDDWSLGKVHIGLRGFQAALIVHKSEGEGGGQSLHVELMTTKHQIYRLYR